MQSTYDRAASLPHSDMAESTGAVTPLVRFWLERMLKIRYFEQKAKDLWMQGLIKGSVHLYTGEEAVAVGVCAALKDDDYITSTHRGHGHCIAKGADIRRMMAELLGREAGYCRGKGGSMHIADFDIGILGANGIVGGGIGLATGVAFAQKQLGTGRVVACFFGDGASNQGILHESLNLASVWRLPVVYVCENNRYAISVPVGRSTSVQDIALRAVGYDVVGVTVDGMDVQAVHEVATAAVKRAREESLPTVIEAKTYRYEGHFVGDPEPYRTKEEVAEWRQRDGIVQLKTRLALSGIISEQDISQLEEDIAADINEAARWARQCSVLDPARATEDVYA